MFKALVLFAMSAVLSIGLMSFLAIHVEAFIYTDFAMPRSFLPIDIVRGNGLSLGLVLAAGLGAGLHSYLFRRLVVHRWRLVSEEQFNRLNGKTAKKASP